MNELIDNILRAAAIPVLVIVGVGTAYLISLMRSADQPAERRKAIGTYSKIQGTYKLAVCILLYILIGKLLGE